MFHFFTGYFHVWRVLTKVVTRAMASNHFPLTFGASHDSSNANKCNPKPTNPDVYLRWPTKNRGASCLWLKYGWQQGDSRVSNSWKKQFRSGSRLDAHDCFKNRRPNHDRKLVLQRATWLQTRRLSHDQYLRSALSWAPQSHGPAGYAGSLCTAQSLLC